MGFAASLLRLLLGALVAFVLVAFFAFFGMSGEQVVGVSALLLSLAYALRQESRRSLRGPMKRAEFLVMLLIAAVVILVGFFVNDRLSYSDVLLLKGRFYFVCVGYVFLALAVVGAIQSAFMKTRDRDAA
jgi:hypothetical protein